MIIYTERPPTRIVIGKQGESISRQIIFNWDSWAEEFPSGLVSIIFRRPDMDHFYPVVENEAVSPAVWSPDLAALSVSGEGRLIVKLIQGSSVLKTTEMLTKTEASSDIVEGDPPDAWLDWLGDVMGYATSAGESKDAASDSEQAALLSEQHALASEQAALLSEQHALASEQAALLSEQASSNALSDQIEIAGEVDQKLIDAFSAQTEATELAIEKAGEANAAAILANLKATLADEAAIAVNSLLPLWSDIELDVTTAPHGEPSKSISQDNEGIHIILGLPDGEKGETGESGLSAYDQAVEGGYTGTIEEFYADFSLMNELVEDLFTELEGL